MRFLASIILFAAITWCAALLWFVVTMPTQALPPSEKADALIVLTGGSGRIEHGLGMLAAGAAPVMLISGVGEHVTEEQILNENASASLRDAIYARDGEIVLDHIARSTVSNAEQSAKFIRRRGVQRIRLVTANYHMKRSVAEFHAAMPEIEILPDPVSPENFRRDRWWNHENTRRLVFSELHKYFAVVARDQVRPARVQNGGE